MAPDEKQDKKGEVGTLLAKLDKQAGKLLNVAHDVRNRLEEVLRAEPCGTEPKPEQAPSSCGMASKLSCLMNQLQGVSDCLNDCLDRLEI